MGRQYIILIIHFYYYLFGVNFPQQIETLSNSLMFTWMMDCGSNSNVVSLQHTPNIRPCQTSIILGHNLLLQSHVLTGLEIVEFIKLCLYNVRGMLITPTPLNNFPIFYWSITKVNQH